jgi:uncharacterized membrane protein YidH (DUF202 family)
VNNEVIWLFLFKLVPILFIIIGILNVVFPKLTWYMRVGWQFKNAEPSEYALIIARIGGVIAIVVGLFLLFSGFPRTGPF